MKEIILYIATSLDGFIADKDGNVDWLPQPKNDEELKAVGYLDLMSRIDTILMGRRSFQQILGFGEWGWPDKQTYVFTSKPLDTETNVSYIEATHDSLLDFMPKLSGDKDCWLLGGAELVQSFAKVGLIDEIILTIIPRSLGTGISLGLSLDTEFVLVGEKPLMDGMHQKIYKKPNSCDQKSIGFSFGTFKN